MPGIRKGHVVELECIFAHFQETRSDIKTTGVGLATDAANINDKRITGDSFPFPGQCFLVDEVIQKDKGMDVRVPIAFVLLGKLVGSDTADHLGPLGELLTFVEVVKTTPI